jgi:hypothetical protein
MRLNCVGVIFMGNVQVWRGPQIVIVRISHIDVWWIQLLIN